MAWLGRQRLLRELVPRGDRRLFRRTVILLVSLPLGSPFSAALGADEDAPSPFVFFSSSFLLAVATLTYALCLTASIYAKDK